MYTFNSEIFNTNTVPSYEILVHICNRITNRFKYYVSDKIIKYFDQSLKELSSSIAEIYISNPKFRNQAVNMANELMRLREAFDNDEIEGELKEISTYDETSNKEILCYEFTPVSYIPKLSGIFKGEQLLTVSFLPLNNGLYFVKFDPNGDVTYHFPNLKFKEDAHLNTIMIEKNNKQYLINNNGIYHIKSNVEFLGYEILKTETRMFVNYLFDDEYIYLDNKSFIRNDTNLKPGDVSSICYNNDICNKLSVIQTPELIINVIGQTQNTTVQFLVYSDKVSIERKIYINNQLHNQNEPSYYKYESGVLVGVTYYWNNQVFNNIFGNVSFE